MKVLVTGSEGMLGKAVMRSLEAQGYETIGADIRDQTHKVDITKDKETFKLIKAIGPDLIVHCAAYTDVDGCEANQDVAYKVNSEATKTIAAAAGYVDAFLIYISTDYIFNGTKSGPYKEEDKPDPISVYGKSKLEGEKHIYTILDKHLIIRSSWLFGPGGHNFVDGIIDKAVEKKELKVVNDQAGSPTYTIDLAEAISQAIRGLRIKDSGLSILNITNSGSCTWYEYAKEILRAKGIRDVRIEPINTEQSKRPARRPKMSLLDNSKFVDLCGEGLPDWRDALGRYLNSNKERCRK